MPGFISQYPIVEIGIPRFESATRRYYAGMDFRQDLGVLFPFINSEVPGAQYYSKPHMILFRLQGHNVRAYPRSCVSGPFETKDQAREFAHQLMEMLNDLHSRRHEITPSHASMKYSSPIDVLRLLPSTNCAECGHKTCMAFAAFVSRGKTDIDLCPYLSRPISNKRVYPVLNSEGEVVSTIEMDVRIKPEPDKAEKADQQTTALPLAKKEFDTDNENMPLPFGESSRLTARELEVLRLVAEGFTNKQICGTLQISHHTVKSHVDHIFNKLGVFDRTQAAVWAVRNSLV